MSESLTFTRYPATTGISLSYLMDARQENRGIYILKFSDGTEYVGKAADMLSRFRTHARHSKEDIISVDFAPVLRSNLDTLEFVTIRWRQGEGARLRNILMAGSASTSRRPDHWLPGSYPLAFRVLSLETNEQPQQLRRAWSDDNAMRSYARLLGHPSADSVINAMAAFLHYGMSLPVLSEQQIWVVTAVPDPMMAFVDWHV